MRKEAATNQDHGFPSGLSHRPPTTTSLLVCALLLLASVAAAQSGPAPSFDPDDQPHAGDGIDSVSPYNGQLGITVPIGPVYQVGPGLSFQIRLYYSSHVWGPGNWAAWPPTYVYEPYMVLQGDPALGLGWTFSLGKIVEAGAGVPAAYIGPEGAAHRLYDRRVYCASGCPAVDGFFYTRDGSYLRVKSLGTGLGYKLWFPNGNQTTFDKQVTNLDDPPLSYTSDYGRGRNGWYPTSMATAYGDAITVSYQASYPWVPSQITIPSVGGSGSRVLTVNMSGGRIGSFVVPTFTGTNATYTLTHNPHGAIQRPITHPTSGPPGPPDPTPYFLDKIDLPILGYSYSFDYAFFNSVRYAAGALSRQTVPTGATVDYQYGTWTFYHANPQNRPPNACGYPPPPLTGPTLETGPDGLEPILPPIGDCGSPDRSAGVVKRTVNYTVLGGTDSAVTKYYQLDYSNGGESGSTPGAQTQTLVLSPANVDGLQRSTTYLFTASTPNSVSSPLVGALLRQAVFAGDKSSSIPDTLNAERVWRYTYDLDPYNVNPTSAASESFEANRRLLQSVVIYSGISWSASPTGKYHTIDYQFDTNAGQYKKETHSGTIGGDARETETAWVPLIGPSNWKLDEAQNQYLRATAGNFASTTNSFDSKGFVISTTVTDGNSYGNLVHDTPRDSLHGFPSSEKFTLGTSTYNRTLSFSAGSPKTAQWDTMTWKSVDNDIDSTTGLVKTSTDPSGLATSFTYDVLSRPRRTTPPGADAETEITYDNVTESTARTPPSGTPEYAWTHTFADSLGRPIKVQRKMPGAVVVKKITRYDRQGNTVFESEWVTDTTTDGSAKGTSYSIFDDFGRARTITRADGKTTTLDFSDTSFYPNSVWFRKVTISGVGGGDAVTKYTSDAFGNLVKVTESPDGTTNWDTGYAYNPQDRLTCAKQGGTNDMTNCTSNPSGQYRRYDYDAFGFLRKENFPEKKNVDVTYSYDALGNVTTEVQPAPGSVTIDRTYDGAGRLTTVKSSSISYVTNCYDGSGPCPGSSNHPGPGGSHPIGKLTHRVGFNPVGTPTPPSISEDFEYDNVAGRLSLRTTSISNSAIPPVTEIWIYDSAGHLVQYDHPRSSGLFAVSTIYDYGYPTKVRANGLPVVVGATYYPSGLLASFVTGNDTGHNVTTTVGEDANKLPRPARISTTGASQNFDTGAYAYDGAGNITGMSPDTFVYDRMSRLKTASFGTLSQSYSYDQYGNLTGTTGYNARPYSIDADTNRLNSPVQYDSRGNLTNIGTDIYTWDAVGRTVRSQGVSPVDWHYLYSGGSERLVKIPLSGATSDYVWTFRDEANRVATEYVGPTLGRDNVYLGNLLVGSYASCLSNGVPGWTYYSSDHLGTPRLITDASGTTVDLRKYWPYGEEASVIQSSSPVRLRLAGMERDREENANRYYDHARSYDFQLVGRFLSVDPIAGQPSNPQSFNLFKYASANPLRLVDPTGAGDECGSGIPCVQSGVFENGNFKPSGKLISPSFANDIRDSLTNNQLSAYLHDLASDRQIDPFFQQIFHTGIDLLQLPTDYSDPKQLFPFLLAVVGQEGGALARELGGAGEAAAGIARNTERIESVFRTAKYRIPDGLDWTGRVLAEVKNVAKLAYTSQLRDFAAFAAQRGLRFDLYVRHTTEISGPLMRDILGGAINLRFLP